MEEDNLEDLSRRERRKILREQEKGQKEGRGVARKLGYLIGGLAVVAAVGAGIWWLYNEATKPLPGQIVADLGAEHTTNISDVTYNSNPPTSGKHFPVWAKGGVYDRVISDGHLLHSLEHGYVVISYNCSQPITNHQSLITPIFAHETEEPHEEPVDASPSGEFKPLTRMTVQPQGSMSWVTVNNPPPVEVELPESFKSDQCKKLVDDLSSFLKDFDRLIIVPRLNLDALVALTAWGRIDTLDKFDSQRIKIFIAAFHNKGPEKTTE